MRKQFLIILGFLAFLSGCKVDNTGFGSIIDDGSGVIGATQAVKINSWFPASTTVLVNYNATETFFVSSSSVRAGVSFSYVYTLGGTEVQNSTNSTYILDGSLYAIGSYVLKVTVSDGFSEDSYSWNVQINGPPVINSYTPNAATAKTNYESDITFTVSATDPNSDTLTYTWKFDGDATVMTNSGASGTLTPTEDMIGDHTILVEVNDGGLTTSRSWTLDVNYHYNACNNLAIGQVCTHGAMASVGNSLNPTTDPFNFRLQPTNITFDDLNNPIISDETNDVIWYWNRTGSQVTRAGVAIPTNQMKVIIGTGVGGTTGDGGPALEAQINNPRSAVYDSRDGMFYVADFSGSRVRSVSSTGEINTITTTIAGQVCNNPGQMQLFGDHLYIPCYGTHVVYTYKVNTPSIGTVTRIAGIYNTGAGVIADGDPLTARLNRPVAVKLDSSGNVYIREREGCRVRVLNRQGSPILFGGISIPAGEIKTIVGSTTANRCVASGIPGATINDANGNFDLGYGLEIGTEVGGVATLIYIPSYQSDDVRVANFSGAPVLFGSTSISDGTINRAYGNGTPGYTGEGDILTRRLNDPYGISYDPVRTEMLIADTSNFRVRNISSSHISTRLIGRGVGRAVAWNFFVDSETDTREAIFNSPYGIVWDSVRKALFTTNTGVHRISQVDRYGTVKTVVGTANGGAILAEDELPTQSYMNQPQGITIYQNDVYIYADRINGVVRAWNRGSTGVTVFNNYISAGRVVTIAGNSASPSGYNGLSGSALTMRLNNPSGVTTDGTNLFIADSSNHCIRKVDTAGNMTTVAGVCTDAVFGAEDQPANTVTLNLPEEIAADANGNLYIADRGNNRIRFVNLNTSPSVSIGTRTIAQGNMHTVACGGATTGDGIATTLSCSAPYGVAVRTGQFCFSTAGHHNVRCVKISNGQTTTVFGQPPSNARGGAPFHEEQEGIAGSEAYLQSPRGLAFDAANELLFISDNANHLVRRLYLGPVN